MGILSSSFPITRYKIEGDPQKDILEQVYTGLDKNFIEDIDDKRDVSDTIVGWTCFENPFSNKFNRESFLIGTYIVFSMRIDSRNIPSKVLKKEFEIERSVRLKETGRDFLSKQEKKDIKDAVIHKLSLTIPMIPNVYDVVWQYEEKLLLFFSNLKKSNEELETLFYKSFNLRLIRLFPFTIAELTLNLSDMEKNILINLSPTCFTE